MRASEAQARQLSMVASRTDNAVVLTDADGRIEWVNDGFTRISGYQPDEVIGKTPGSMLQGADTDSQVVEEMSAAIKRHEQLRATTLEFRHVLRGGRVAYDPLARHVLGHVLADVVEVPCDDIGPHVESLGRWVGL